MRKFIAVLLVITILTPIMNVNATGSLSIEASTENAKSIPVLMFHKFYDAEFEKPLDQNWHSIQSFEAFLVYLNNENYKVLTMDEFYLWFKGKLKVPKKSLVITIDDGITRTYQYAQPLLEKHQITATSFQIVSLRENLLEERLNLPYIELHSHTYNMHYDGKPKWRYAYRGVMQGINYKKGLADLKKSRELLQGSPYFCYPFGGYKGHAIKMVKKAGFKLAFTVREGKVKRGMNPFLLPRVRVRNSPSLKKFAALIKT